MRYDLIAEARQRLKEKYPKKYSLRALADRIGISHQAIHQIERGETTPSVATLAALCRELGLDANEVLTDEAPAAPSSKQTA